MFLFAYAINKIIKAETFSLLNKFMSCCFMRKLGSNIFCTQKIVNFRWHFFLISGTVMDEEQTENWLEGFGIDLFCPEEQEQFITERFQTMKQQLEENPYYFLSWHPKFIREVSKWSRKLVAKFVVEITQYTPCPRSMVDIKEIGFSQFQSFEIILIFFIESFLFIEIGVSRWAAKATKYLHLALAYAELWNKKGELNTEYLPGIQFLRKLVHCHILLKKGKLPKDDDDESWEEIYQNMPNKSKAMVLGAKAIFLGGFHPFSTESKANSVAVMREVVKLDPKSYEWHYRFQNWLRCERRSLGNYAPPSQEELTLVWETYDKCEYSRFRADDPAKASFLRNAALAGLCQALAEVIKHKSYGKDGNYPVKISKKLVFNSETEMVDFVKDNVQRLMDNDDVSFAELIRAGEILSNILPFQYRQFVDAEKYYLEAWAIIPSNSKINHKLGILYLISEELHDMEKCLKFLRLAVRYQPHNFPATMDLIQSLLATPSANEEELEGLFDMENSLDLSAVNLSQLYFAQGCYLFMNGHLTGAIKYWIDAAKTNASNEMFASLKSTSKRYKWDIKLMHFVKIKECLQNHLSAVEDEDEKEIVSKLLASIPAPKMFRENAVPRTRQSSVSDSDNNWRAPRGNPISPKPANDKYVPPCRRAADSQHYQNNRTPRGNSSGSWR